MARSVRDDSLRTFLARYREEVGVPKQTEPLRDGNELEVTEGLGEGGRGLTGPFDGPAGGLSINEGGA